MTKTNKIVILLITVLFLLIGFYILTNLQVSAAPDVNYFRHVDPETTDSYDLGSTSTPYRWRYLNVYGITLNGTLRTTWPTGGAGGSGLWATTSDELAIHPDDVTDVVIVGDNSTSSVGYIFEVDGDSLFDGDVFFNENATSSKTIYANEFGLNSVYIDEWSDITDNWGWSTTSEQYFLNNTSTWAYYDTNWDRNFNATSTWHAWDSNWDNSFNSTSTWHAFDGLWDTRFIATSTWSGDLIVDGNVTSTGNIVALDDLKIGFIGLSASTTNFSGADLIGSGDSGNYYNAIDVEGILQEIAPQLGLTATTTFSWKDPVISKDLATPPGAPSIGDRYIVGSESKCPPGWDGWVDIVIQSSQIPADITDYTMYFEIASSTADLFTDAQADGSDIVFFDDTDYSDVADRLPHQIELYSAGSTFLGAWIKMSTFDADADTTLHLCYDADSGDYESDESVWNDDFGIVYYYEDPDGGSGEDKSKYGNDPPSAVIGDPASDDSFMGHGVAFDGNDAWNMGFSGSGWIWEDEWGQGSEAHTRRSKVTVFTTGADVTARQTLYAEGGGSNGDLLYVYNGKVYMRQWAETNGWGNYTTDTTHQSIGGVTANTTYMAIANFECNDQTVPCGSGEQQFHLGLYGSSLTSHTASTTPGPMNAHSGEGGIVYTGTNSKDYHDTTGTNLYFTGTIHHFGLYQEYFDANYSTTLFNNYMATSTFYTISGEQAAGGATGAWAGQENAITEWNGSDWTFETPEDGWATVIQDEDGQIYVYVDGVTGFWQPITGTGIQNLWEVIFADSGSATADDPNDTFSILGGTGISTAIVGDVLTITNDSPNADQDIWLTITSDSGSVSADTNADILTFVGSGGLDTSISGDILTINDAWEWTTSSANYWETQQWRWTTSSEQNFWNTTSTWNGFDTNWDRMFIATTTWAGFNNLFDTRLNASTTIAFGDCSAGEILEASATGWECGTDDTGGAGGNPFDQWLDTTSTPTFAGINATTTNADDLTVYDLSALQRMTFVRATGTNYLSIDKGGTISHLDFSTDLYVQDDVEIDGDLWLDGGTIKGASNLEIDMTGNFLNIKDNVNLLTSGSQSPWYLAFTEDADNGNNYAAFKAPASINTNHTYVLPSSTPTSTSQFLQSDTSGVLTWGTDMTGGGSGLWTDGGGYAYLTANGDSARVYNAGDGTDYIDISHDGNMANIKTDGAAVGAGGWLNLTADSFTTGMIGQRAIGFMTTTTNPICIIGVETAGYGGGIGCGSRDFQNNDDATEWWGQVKNDDYVKMFTGKDGWRMYAKDSKGFELMNEDANDPIFFEIDQTGTDNDAYFRISRDGTSLWSWGLLAADDEWHLNDNVAGVSMLTVSSTEMEFGAGAAGQDYTFSIKGETTSLDTIWMEDEDYWEMKDDLFINSSELIYFRDTAIHLGSATDGHLDLAADVSVDLNTPIIDLSAQDTDFSLKAASAFSFDFAEGESKYLTFNTNVDRLVVNSGGLDIDFKVNGLDVDDLIYVNAESNALGVATTTAGSWRGEEFNVNGNSLFYGGVTTTNFLWVGSGGTADYVNLANGDLYVQDGVEIDGGLWASSATTTDSLFIGGYASSTSGLFTQGSGWFGGDLTVGGNSLFGGNSTTTGDVVVGSDTSTATSTLVIGNSDTTRGGCLIIEDNDQSGNFTYCSTNGGVMTCGTTDCSQ